MEKVIDDDGRGVKWSYHTVVVSDIFQSLIFAERRDFFVKRAPIGTAVAAKADYLPTPKPHLSRNLQPLLNNRFQSAFTTDEDRK